MRLRSPSVGFTLLAAVALFSAVPAEGRESYRRGIQALEQGRLEMAAQLMEEAIAHRSEEKARLPRYTPYFFLGSIRYQLDDCRSALEALSVSEQQGAIEKTKSFSELREMKADCTSRVEEAAAGSRAVAQAEGEFRELERTLASLAQRPEIEAEWSSGSNSFAARQLSSSSAVERALEAAEQADQTLDVMQLETSAQEIGAASQQLTELIGEVRQQLDQMSLALSSALEQLENASRIARRRLASTRQLEPYPENLGAAVASLRSVLARADREKGTASETNLLALEQAVSTESNRLRRLASRPPKRLLAAAEAFLARDYSGVLTLLGEEDSTSSSSRITAHTLLLQSAAEFALYKLGGEQDSETRASANRRIRELRQLEVELILDETFFSPSFLSYFREISQTEDPDDSEQVTETDSINSVSGDG